jgi:hypothetical protein
MQLIDYRPSHKRPNHAIQGIASQLAIYLVAVCHPRLGCESRFTGLALADLVSR